MKNVLRLFLSWSGFALFAPAIAVETVTTDGELALAVAQARPGAVIKIAPGTYRGGVRLRNTNGTLQRPITISASDPAEAPVFVGGGTSWHLSDCSYVVIQNLIIRDATGNGINVDDGGDYSSPATHIVLDGITVLDTGPTGNRDGVKMSGVDRFVVRNCKISGWGGSAIDMVGCHDGVVERCQFNGKEGFSQSNAVQMKGGSRRLRILQCEFKDVGQRAINIGGSTGLAYFRPKADDYEAADIEVAGNHFEGSMGPIVWATAKGGWVHHNTIVNPDKWVLRILQENQGRQFAPCRGGRFEDNVIAYGRQVAVQVNVGAGTAPESFSFRRNSWLTPGARSPKLPVDEVDGKEVSWSPGDDLEEELMRQFSLGRGAKAFQSAELFTCDFEDKNWHEKWEMSARRDLVEIVSADDEREFRPLDGKALRIKVKKSGHYGASLEYRFRKNHGNEPESVYFRYYLRFADDWNPQRGGKLPGLAGTYGRAGWGGRPVDGKNGWSARGLFEGQKANATLYRLLLLPRRHERKVWFSLDLGSEKEWCLGKQPLVLHRAIRESEFSRKERWCDAGMD